MGEELAEGGLALAYDLDLSPDGTEGHPLRSHRVSGTPDEHELAKAGVRFEGAMSCMTCHDPHKGRSRHLFRWAVAVWVLSLGLTACATRQENDFFPSSVRAGPSEACSHCHDR